MWLKTDNIGDEKPTLALPPCSSYQRRLTYQEVGRIFPQLYLKSAQTESHGARYIEVSLMTEQQKLEKEKERREESEVR